MTLMSKIAYVPSYRPKIPKPVPKLLEDEDDWVRLIADVGEYIRTSKAKNKGHGIVKSFTITIVDTSSGGDPKDISTKKVST